MLKEFLDILDQLQVDYTQKRVYPFAYYQTSPYYKYMINSGDRKDKVALEPKVLNKSVAKDLVHYDIVTPLIDINTAFISISQEDTIVRFTLKYETKKYPDDPGFKENKISQVYHFNLPKGDYVDEDNLELIFDKDRGDVVTIKFIIKEKETEVKKYKFKSI